MIGESERLRFRIGDGAKGLAERGEGEEGEGEGGGGRRNSIGRQSEQKKWCENRMV